jgi:hypothetical protein
MIAQSMLMLLAHESFYPFILAQTTEALTQEDMQPARSRRRFSRGWQTRFDDAQPRAGTLTQRHGRLIGTWTHRVESGHRRDIRDTPKGRVATSRHDACCGRPDKRHASRPVTTALKRDGSSHDQGGGKRRLTSWKIKLWAVPGCFSGEALTSEAMRQAPVCNGPYSLLIGRDYWRLKPPRAAAMLQ